ncbi:hypothetical protein KP509_05G002100 [Ceratopteris richardii]|uniref:Rhodanese domain-containing protein n=1 Tax=Ceratopteris richardii TaxID=49495 RepID=A0A8T2UR85_CERRI|nr:hypothetical protein KP509_05G002100 [Ceratopteris richardii]
MQMEGPKNAHAHSDTQAEIIRTMQHCGYGGSVAALRLAEAGLKACLLEKGRQWEAHQFPTSAWQTLGTTRWHTPLGVSGSSNSLYQIHYQGAVIAFVAAGLGGGSLINGGVVLPTPARAKRDPRWPLEWSGAAWDNAQSRARSMLQEESVAHAMQLLPRSRS